jgi:hypothetical protein
VAVFNFDNATLLSIFGEGTKYYVEQKISTKVQRTKNLLNKCKLSNNENEIK